LRGSSSAIEQIEKIIIIDKRKFRILSYCGQAIDAL